MRRGVLWAASGVGALIIILSALCIWTVTTIARVVRGFRFARALTQTPELHFSHRGVVLSGCSHGALGRAVVELRPAAAITREGRLRTWRITVTNLHAIKDVTLAVCVAGYPLIDARFVGRRKPVLLDGVDVGIALVLSSLSPPLAQAALSSACVGPALADLYGSPQQPVFFELNDGALIVEVRRTELDVKAVASVLPRVARVGLALCGIDEIPAALMAHHIVQASGPISGAPVTVPGVTR